MRGLVAMDNGKKAYEEPSDLGDKELNDPSFLHAFLSVQRLPDLEQYSIVGFLRDRGVAACSRKNEAINTMSVYKLQLHNVEMLQEVQYIQRLQKFEDIAFINRALNKAAGAPLPTLKLYNWCYRAINAGQGGCQAARNVTTGGSVFDLVDLREDVTDTSNDAASHGLKPLKAMSGRRKWKTAEEQEWEEKKALAAVAMERWERKDCLALADWVRRFEKDTLGKNDPRERRKKGGGDCDDGDDGEDGEDDSVDLTQEGVPTQDWYSQTQTLAEDEEEVAHLFTLNRSRIHHSPPALRVTHPPSPRMMTTGSRTRNGPPHQQQWRYHRTCAPHCTPTRRKGFASLLHSRSRGARIGWLIAVEGSWLMIWA
jgi:hypothetical protein